MQQFISKLNRGLGYLKNWLTAKVWPKKSIVFYAGTTTYPHYDWSPLGLKTGLGGSEIAAINLAKEWVKLGYQVTVYNRCNNQEGIYEGVEYLHYSKFNRYDTFDTLVIWRFPWTLYPKTKANRIWLELQEMLLPQQVTKEKLRLFQKIFVKSNYHRSMMPEIEDQQIAIIPNGVDKKYSQWSQNPKDPYKLIYASNYTRGLERMLAFGWPIIKKEVPQASLHIYYGWPALNPKNPDDENTIGTAAWRKKMEQLMAQPGIIDHGKIGVEELVKEKSTCAIHYYGCSFQETDCVSVRESALVGCVPVTSSYSALGEKQYCVRVSGNPYQQETQENIAHKIVELLNNQDRLQLLRQDFQELAKAETWDNIAKSWIDYAVNKS
ncbi:hypothetical protein PCC8801_2594 [Rippkaea orientalis PCC 8801]|uniref:Glycosyl transferase group 1 n=1 Tax=Rippkaea orientalis (strain PCC 8801 / RF-1) TaxID=41431 RepID=B7K4U3_RIPO1|nr:glycosyltransferase [Rippkaea orientalis]ACK66599.1 hypothetical protein PCC8801_2594 [Rippkaea orientalis PCC 8801]